MNRLMTRLAYVLVVISFVVGVFSISVLATWTPAPPSPPACPDTIEGCNAPVNVSSISQVKQGDLSINGVFFVRGMAGGGVAPNSLTIQYGNVGIGTLSSSDKLTVKVANRGGISIISNGTTNNQQAALHLKNLAGNNGMYLGRSYSGTDSNDFFIYDAALGQNRFYISSTGNIGIGTIAPGAKLEINGTIKITGGNPVAGKVLTSTDSSGTAEWRDPASGGGTSPTTSCSVPISTASLDGEDGPGSFTGFIAIDLIPSCTTIRGCTFRVIRKEPNGVYRTDNKIVRFIQGVAGMHPEVWVSSWTNSQYGWNGGNYQDNLEEIYHGMGSNTDFSFLDDWLGVETSATKITFHDNSNNFSYIVALCDS